MGDAITMDEIMGTRDAAETQLLADADRFNELSRPLMANEAAHKKREAMRREAESRLVRSALLVAWHLRRAQPST